MKITTVPFLIQQSISSQKESQTQYAHNPWNEQVIGYGLSTKADGSGDPEIWDLGVTDTPTDGVSASTITVNNPTPWSMASNITPATISYITQTLTNKGVYYYLILESTVNDTGDQKSILADDGLIFDLYLGTHPTTQRPVSQLEIVTGNGRSCMLETTKTGSNNNFSTITQAIVTPSEITDSPPGTFRVQVFTSSNIFVADSSRLVLILFVNVKYAS